MAGSQKKILLDSNSYFRLAYSIHPLLSQEFGDERYCLYVVPNLEEEHRRNPRLRNKFHWVREKKFASNRKRPLNISKHQKTEIKETGRFLRSAALSIDYPPNESIPSPVDIEVVAFGFVLEIPIVTDDRAMHRLAKEYEVSAMSTLELLKVMLEQNHINQEKIVEIGGFWVYENDLPAKFQEEWQKLFKLPFPKE